MSPAAAAKTFSAALSGAIDKADPGNDPAPI